jgi:pimeloyl-ACP methyl ester carboxylesterase
MALTITFSPKNFNMKNSTVFSYLWLSSIIILLILPVNVLAQVVAKKVRTGSSTIPFLLSKPYTHDVTSPNRKYPLIIFLHGGGALQSNDTSLAPGAPVWQLTGWGPMREVGWQNNNLRATWNNKTDSFCVIQPLGPLPVGSAWPITYIDAMIKYGTDSLKVDTNRIYLCGHSWGGAGVFNYLNNASGNAEKLAAAVPVSAWNIALRTNGANNVSAAKLPLWGFHAADDANTEPDTTNYSVNRLNAVNPQVKPLLTIWPAGVVTPHPHNSAPEYVFAIHQYPYLEDGVINIYEWFLGQNNDSLPNILPVARAGNDTTITASSGVANLNASASTDADGTIVRYVWRKIAGPAGGTIATSFGTASSTTVSGLTTTGIYKFQLNVVDHRSAIARDTINITVVNTLYNGKSLNTAAPNGRVAAGTDVTQLTSASKFTLEALIKIDSTASNWTTIIRKGYNGNNRIMFHVGPGDNSLWLIMNNNSYSEGYTAAGVISPGNWYHVAAVFDGTQTGNANRLKIYLNGVQQSLSFNGTIPATTSSLLANQSFYAGSNHSDGHIDHIDEVRVWNTALSGLIIDDWKNKLLGDCHPNIANLVLYWPLNDDSNPTIAPAGLGTAYTGYVATASYENATMATVGNGCSGSRMQPAVPAHVSNTPSMAGVIYPNPTQGDLRLAVTSTRAQTAVIFVIDMQGKYVNTKKVYIVKGANLLDLDISSLHSGNYIIDIRAGNTSLKKFKILKN